MYWFDKYETKIPLDNVIDNISMTLCQTLTSFIGQTIRLFLTKTKLKLI